jgi:hypothetical protein
MTMRFQKSLFETKGDCVFYQGKFVARFKWRKAPVTKAMFLKRLIAEHTVESYFSKLASGKAPLQILLNMEI